MTVGEAIRKARKDRGYSVLRLANKSGVQRVTIYKYEQDKQQPRLWCLIAIADALNISLDELVGRNRQEEISKPCTQEKYFSPHDVRNMTPKEIHDNYSAIRQSMKRWN